MRLMIGTLYTIENEFEECVAAIKRQSYGNFEHVVFKGLRKQEAHHALFSTFREQAHAFRPLTALEFSVHSLAVLLKGGLRNNGSLSAYVQVLLTALSLGERAARRLRAMTTEDKPYVTRRMQGAKP